jgi:hypothetical protein
MSIKKIASIPWLLELVAQLGVKRPKAFEKPVTDGVKRA